MGFSNFVHKTFYSLNPFHRQPNYVNHADRTGETKTGLHNKGNKKNRNFNGPGYKDGTKITIH